MALFTPSTNKYYNSCMEVKIFDKRPAAEGFLAEIILEHGLDMVKEYLYTHIYVINI